MATPYDSIDRANWDAVEAEELAEQMYLDACERNGVTEVRWWVNQTDRTRRFFLNRAERELAKVDA